jgi:hypothetical protein
MTGLVIDAITSSERAMARNATRMRRERNIFILLWIADRNCGVDCV